MLAVPGASTELSTNTELKQTLYIQDKWQRRGGEKEIRRGYLGKQRIGEGNKKKLKENGGQEKAIRRSERKTKDR